MSNTEHTFDSTISPSYLERLFAANYFGDSSDTSAQDQDFLCHRWIGYMGGLFAGLESVDTDTYETMCANAIEAAIRDLNDGDPADFPYDPELPLHDFLNMTFVSKPYTALPYNWDIPGYYPVLDRGIIVRFVDANWDLPESAMLIDDRYILASTI